MLIRTETGLATIRPQLEYRLLWINQTVLEDARRLISAGADTELIVLFLRDRGFDQIDSILAVRDLMALSHTESKKLVTRSKAWADRFETVQQLHEDARKALLELAASRDKNLPKIELVGFDDVAL